MVLRLGECCCGFSFDSMLLIRFSMMLGASLTLSLQWLAQQWTGPESLPRLNFDSMVLIWFSMTLGVLVALSLQWLARWTRPERVPGERPAPPVPAEQAPAAPAAAPVPALRVVEEIVRRVAACTGSQRKSWLHNVWRSVPC